jgi:WD40 repeat protein
VARRRRATRCSLPGYFGNRAGIAFSPDGGTVATASAANQVSLWDVATGRLRERLFVHCPVPAVAFSPDGAAVAVWTTESTQTEIVVWDVAARSRRISLLGHSSPARDVVFHPDGHTIASLSPDEAGIRLWDAATGREECRLEWTNRAFSPGGVAFAADGSGLLTVHDPNVPADLWSWGLLGSGEKLPRERGNYHA